MPLRYTFNYEALIYHLDNNYHKSIESIDAEAQAEKNRLTQNFSSLINPLKGIFGMNVQIQSQSNLETSNC